MKRTLLFVALAVVGLSSCKTQCPAYSSTKPATHVASPITASTSESAAARQ
ncbi:hypothetical protein J0X19_19060 [Hymenobacter sp. BT186]|uniref:Uncharacterized protein n=1 Tax=Hymenobacter telluris TaxID=2816474 RepID=A0A939F294_9BACT|nr:hypothetical protein [Hymenobacter telluris]MBW3376095.1 hypothetical protein [Hymenobacter norwichensis]